VRSFLFFSFSVRSSPAIVIVRRFESTIKFQLTGNIFVDAARRANTMMLGGTLKLAGEYMTNLNSNAQSFGAYRADWKTFSKICLRDLLPVVSDPAAVISPTSGMSQLGKTPSLFTRRGVVGIADWTSKITTQRDIDEWSKVPNYGICIQTRYVRAIDIDIVNVEKAQEVRDFIRDAGYDFPLRYREGTGKCLLAFIVDASCEINKGIVKTEDGAIEFLGNGQQFIAAGTHPDGTRYEWTSTDFPEITLEEYEKLRDAIADTFSGGSVIEMSGRRNAKGGKVENDEIAVFLEGKGLVKGKNREGHLFIDCPFKNEHTSDGGLSSTVYMPKGGRNYGQGHFKCLHAHCAGRNDIDFQDALGYRIDVFTHVSPAAGQKPVLSKPGEVSVVNSDADLPSFRRTRRGEIEPIVNNVKAALLSPEFCGLHIAYDTFKGMLMVAAVGDVIDGVIQWRPLSDTDYTSLRFRLEQRDFKPVAKDMVRDVLWAVGEMNQIDTAVTWLNSLVWDGVARIDNFMVDYLKAVDTPYAVAVGRYIWTALAGRTLVPGIKADMAPIFEGKQGVGKSTAIRNMAGAPEFFQTMSFLDKSSDLSRQLRGAQVVEIDELKGLNSRDADMIKSFMSRTHESWVPKYVENAVTYPRRMIFIGSTNQTEILADETGNRRWLPIRVGETGKIDAEGIKNDCQQLWAEGAVVFKEIGIAWEDAQALAVDEHEKYRLVDQWEELLIIWLNTVDSEGVKPLDKGYITTREVLENALSIQGSKASKYDQMRIGKVLTSQGFVRTKQRVNGVSTRVFVKN
jgi:hypothetical protein